MFGLWTKACMQAIILKSGTHQVTQICRLVDENLQFIAYYCLIPEAGRRVLHQDAEEAVSLHFFSVDEEALLR